jgi:hypothetical protein
MIRMVAHFLPYGVSQLSLPGLLFAFGHGIIIPSEHWQYQYCQLVTISKHMSYP